MVPAQNLARVGILTGPTAVGKSELALKLGLWAQARKGRPYLEIVNADTLQFYRGLEIGTAKPSVAARQTIPHHLLDVADAGSTLSVGDFVRRLERCLEDIHRRQRRALIVGGAGFYLRALCGGLWDVPASDPRVRHQLESRTTSDLFEELAQQDPQSAQRIGPRDRYRLIRAHEILIQGGQTLSEVIRQHSPTVENRYELWWMDRPGEELQRRIQWRTRQMLGPIDPSLEALSYSQAPERFNQIPWIAETIKHQREHPYSRQLGCVGYRQITEFLRNDRPPGRSVPGIPYRLKDLEEEINLATRQLAQSQRSAWRSQLRISPQYRTEYPIPADVDRLRSAFARHYGL